MGISVLRQMVTMYNTFHPNKIQFFSAHKFDAMPMLFIHVACPFNETKIPPHETSLHREFPSRENGRACPVARPHTDLEFSE